MLDYIEETSDVLTTIMKHKDNICERFLTFVKDKSINQIYLIGSGTSCHAGIATKHFLETILQCKVIPMFPLSFVDQEVIFDTSSLVIGISQSGTSMSTIRALDKAREQKLPTVAMSGISGSAVESHADIAISILCGKEVAVAKTKGYSATVLTLFIVGLEYAKLQKRIEQKNYDKYYHELASTVANIPMIIRASNLWYAQIKEDLLDKSQLMVIGYDTQYGTVLEATLKLLECVRIAVNGYELEEFMHGIYNSIKKDSVLFYIGSKSKYQERAMQLKTYLGKTTQFQYMIASGSECITNDAILPFIDHEYFSVLEYSIPFQCLSYHLALDKGIDPSKPSDPLFHKNMNSKIVG